MISELYNLKTECCGCEACANICPKLLITMRPDEEGFVYPYIENPERCISCNQCMKVCPVKNLEKTDTFSEKAYAAYLNDDDELLLSSSGGLATAISQAFLKTYTGVVFGVRYSEDFKEVLYSSADNEKELEYFRSSKYSQSRKYNCYQRVKEVLHRGKKVLFIGLPCDVYALLRFCNNHENLYVCTLICHGVTSPKVLTEYIDYHLDADDSVLDFSLRNKKEGWKPYYICMETRKKNKFYERFDESVYGNAFLYLKRPSCNVCKVKRGAIHSDVTLGDFHNITETDIYYNKNGVSSVIVHTEKGNELIKMLENVTLKEVDVNKAAKNRGYYEAIPVKKNREEYGRVFSSQGLVAASKLLSCKRIERRERNRAKLLSYLVKIRNSLYKIAR